MLPAEVLVQETLVGFKLLKTEIFPHCLLQNNLAYQERKEI